ncbi:MAG: glycosyltransferase family 2 protein [Halanaerobiales bacterium]|nr:glycosyltransferase family 2 protein [Halanaerobiales bacterium]
MIVKALIPAFNEEKTIGNIIDVLKKVPRIKEIIVVDDGSEDNTYQVAKNLGVRAIRLPENKGKGAALQEGITNLETDIILLLDGDLIGLKSEHIYKLINPVLADQADMTIGIFKKGRNLTDLAQVVSPRLSGQRAIKLSELKKLKELDKKGFGVEVSLNKHFKNTGRVKRVNLYDLTHVMKEEKLGLVDGVKARTKMYIDILRSLFNNIVD